MKNPRTRAHWLARPSLGMPSSTELRFIVAYALAGAVACGGSQTEDFFAGAPPLVAAGASGATGSAGGLATGGAAGSGVTSGGSAGSSIGAGGSTSGSGGTSAAGGSDPGVGGSAGMDPGAGGVGGGTGGVGGGTGGVGGTTGGSAGDAPVAGSPGSGGLGGTGGGAGAGGSNGGAPVGGQTGRGGRGGEGGSGPMQCTAVLTTANKALEAAQVCNLAVSSLQCVDLVETPCGCLVPVAKADSMATKTYLAALRALESCPVSCPAVVCQNPTSGHCEPIGSSSNEGRCVGDNELSTF